MPPQTPKMPFDLVPMNPSLRVSPNKLREEIEGLKAKIKEEDEDLKMLRNDYQKLKADRGNPKFADALVHTLKWITQTNDTITKNKSRLSDAKASLEKVEHEADLRNQGMIYLSSISSLIAFILAILTEYEHVELSQEGPDSAYVLDMSKFQLMKNWLDTEKVLLLRSPPGSGKTSFAVRFAVYLNDYVSVAYFMNASRTLQCLNGGASMNDVWKKQFHLSFQDIYRKSRDRHIYIIVDEAQAWYPGNGLREEAEMEVGMFWSALKAIKEERDWSSYIAELARGASESIAAANSTIKVRLLLLAGYGERSLGSLATPFEFVDPKDPATNQRLPLGLNFLRLNRGNTYELITRYIDIQNRAGKRIPFGHDDRVHDLIFRDTNGHVGAIRTFFFHAVSFDLKTTEDIFRSVSQTIYQTDLRGARAFLSVDAETIAELPPCDLALLIRCIILYKQGHRDFPAVALEAVRLVKYGILIMTSAITVTGNTTLAFPSPMHFDLTLYNVLHRRVTLEQNVASFESALKELVLRMNPKLLKDTTPDGHDPYERQWHVRQNCAN